MKATSDSTPFVTEMTNLFNPSNIQANTNLNANYGHSIFTTIHSDDFIPHPLAVTTTGLKKTTLLGDSLDLDDSYASLNHLTLNLGNRTNHQLLTALDGKFYTSSSKVFNNFTTSHEDFKFSSPSEDTSNEVSEGS
jgi:hypothetical protein